MEETKAPLVYSCSGCSNVAQGANRLAVRLDREGLAEMSCIAGVGAGVFPIVRIAKSGRPILAIDGCPLACCLKALERQDVTPTIHLELSRLGFQKRQHEDLSESQLDELWRDTITPAVRRLSESS
jgi:uncharacterized metal-binding protein